MKLSPGLHYILHQSPRLSIPLILYYALLRFGRLPFPLAHLAPLAALPSWFVLNIIWHEWKNKRDAARLGARLAPRLKGEKFGNADIIEGFLKSYHEGYPGDDTWERVAEQGHTADFRVFWESFIFTTEPAHVKQMLTTEVHNFVKGEQFQGAMASVLGTGVFNSDGDMWKFHRATTRPFFTKERISDFELYDKHASAIITKIKARLAEGYAIDFQDAMFRFTLDTSTEFLFGSCVDSMSSRLPYPYNAPASLSTPQGTLLADEFSEAFQRVLMVIADRMRLGWVWPLQEMFKDETASDMKIINSYVNPIIEEALARHVLEEKESESETLLEHLLKQTTDTKILRDEVINILVAGRDTTAATLCFIIYFLSTYPKVFERVRAEILAQVGPSAMPTREDIVEMKYLRAVINETLRLYPTVPFSYRQAVKPTLFASPDPNKPPIYIPADMGVPFSAFVMHRRTDLWGPDAEEFDPDRFMSNDPRMKKYLLGNPFIYLPFNAGPRICLGQQFAYNEMSFMIIRLVQNFSEITLDMSAHPPNKLPPREWATDKASIGKRRGIDKIHPMIHITMYSHGGLWLRMTETDAGDARS